MMRLELRIRSGVSVLCYCFSLQVSVFVITCACTFLFEWRHQEAFARKLGLGRTRIVRGQMVAGVKDANDALLQVFILFWFTPW